MKIILESIICVIWDGSEDERIKTSMEKSNPKKSVGDWGKEIDVRRLQQII